MAVILLSNIDYKGLPGEGFTKNARKSHIFCMPRQVPYNGVNFFQGTY